VIRGVKSAGMLLSERELMISDNHEGIIDLDGDFAVGTPAAAALGLDDPVIHVSVTPNRPGRARRLRHRPRPRRQGAGAAAPLKVEKVPGGYDSPVSVRIADGQACPMFIGRHFRGLRNGPSPEWLQRPPQGHRPAPHLGAGRHHQLRHVCLRPAAARLRCRQAHRRHHRSAVAPGRDHRGARRPDL
jgi:hypothetical protein